MVQRQVRQGTNLLQHAETRQLYTHKHLLKRPRTHDRKEIASHAIRLNGQDGNQSAKIDDPLVDKRRFELFIDLIWVGIIGNLAENFSEEAFNLESGVDIGNAVWHFVILFLMAWRFWKYLQEFMAKYATDDLVERAFVVWALILALLWGNNAPYLFDPDHQSNLAINIYLVWRGSVLACEAYYAFFIHHIRNRIAIQALFIIPVLPLWISADYVDIDVKAGLVFAAVNVENIAHLIIESPFVNDRFMHTNDKVERIDPDHWTGRIKDFYTIILGEAVLSLIRASPLREGITSRASGGVSALVIYYVLNGFYFNGDQSKQYVHAMKRSWWRKSLWQYFHNALFGATLILGVTVVFLLQHVDDSATKPIESSEPTLKEDENATQLELAVHTAKWTVSISLAVVLVNQTMIALLNRSLDPPGTLKVNSRILRLLPRNLLLPIILCLPIERSISVLFFLGIVSIVLVACLPWEWWSSLERSGGIIET